MVKKIVSLVLVFCLASPGLLQAAEIALRDGRILKGEVIRTASEGLTIKIAATSVPSDLWNSGKLEGCAEATWSGNRKRILTVPWACLATQPPDSLNPSLAAGSNNTDSAEKTMSGCDNRGRIEANSLSTGGSFAGGLAGGIFLGLIGTGIAVLAQSTPEPKYDQLQRIEGDECRYAFTQGYRSKGKSKKQSSALAGGLLGTAALVLIVVTAGSE